MRSALLSFSSSGLGGALCGALAGLLAAASGCSGTPEGSIVLVTGDETDVFSRAPAPVTLVTEKVALDGTKSEVKRTQLPADSVDLGDLPRTSVGGVSVTGLDAAGKALVRGETLLVQWGALEGSTLEVFVQRTGELARMPRGPAAIDATHATMLVGRYVTVTNDTSLVIYDLLGLRTLSQPPALPRPAKSIATVGTAALVIDEAGATTLDLSTGNSFPLDAPTGGTFAEVAGGSRVAAADGTQYIVGATRSAGATPRVLVIDGDGKATFAALTAPREGACASWVEGRGLVVVGGSADGKSAGAEVLAPGASVATPLPFPAESVRGCGAATLDNTHIAIAGGTGATGDTGSGLPVRVLDLACAAACALAPWPDPIALSRAQLVGFAPDAAFVLGDDATGATHAYRASATGMREIPLRIPRRGARLFVTPTNTIGIVGGGAGIEQYLE
jgi:hypothetical protein